MSWYFARPSRLTLLEYVGDAIHIILLIEVELLLVQLDSLNKLAGELSYPERALQLTFCTPACLPLIR
jgi:hypothetical protein